ncbi:site-specific integrase [Actinoplanes lobatus]|uniref:Integrase n=1 Tax=Actinoplanes lobatus TaxID=113568 RepID=A0A7W7HC26_9ACTN|nr:tyrosine-type recombinase/integrase [Actinoplanes lobatus]MBB4747773.1 integrase [Actinoplanes lobatus]GGN96016.1 site-specific integrase [Actinoplanes lobatus]GIE45151.1 site-specific integrase [Actinoplanes lobatus]
MTVFCNAEGWQGTVVVGTRPDGTPDRRKRRGKDENEVRQKLKKLLEEMAAGEVVKAGEPPKLAALMADWLNNPAAEWRYNTKTGSYAWAVNNWLTPGLGAWRCDLLTAEAIESFLRSIYRDPDDTASEGLAPASVHTVFRVLRAILNDAVRRKIIPRNPMDFMTWRPKLIEEEVTPLFVEEVRAILRACEYRRNGTRWSIGLPLGLRQGEALGLPWWQAPKSTRDKPMGLDLDGGWLVVRRQSERRKWEHGCVDPIDCARPHCRTVPCPPRWQHGCGKDPNDCTKQRVDRCPKRAPRPGCATHRDPKTCTKLCPKDCTNHASVCPKRKNGGIVFTDTKSEAGRRRMALATPMIKLGVQHQRHQTQERTAAGEMWTDHNLVWCQPNGRPIDARADWEDWKDVLREAGVRDARVHDGRHTAATMLLLQGVDEQTVMAVMGWSDRRMLRRYQHVIDELRQEASKRVGALLWGAEEKPKKAKKKGKKKPQQETSPSVDAAKKVSATVSTTGEGLAKIIQFPRSA